MSLVNKVISKIKWERKRRKWRLLNKNNETSIINDFVFEHVIVGKKTYGELRVIDHAKPRSEGASLLKIGSFCSIASDVTFVLNGEHNMDRILSFPLEVKFYHNKSHEAFGKGDIVIGDDVWIGHGALILSGVRIGNGSVIAAGSVVVKDIPPYSVGGGIPARVIKKRFNDEIIYVLSQIKYEKIEDEFLHKYKNEFLKSVQGIEDLSFLNKIK